MNISSAIGTVPKPTWQRVLDRTGVCASIGCAIHCMVAPPLLVFAPTLGGIWVHPVAHFAIAAFVLPVAGFALLHGHRKHGKRWIAATGVIGIAFVLIGVFWPLVFAGGSPQAAAEVGAVACDEVCRECCPSVTNDDATGAWTLRVPPASILTLLGGIALVIAHVGNLRACACCRK